MTELRLKFHIPSASLAALKAEMARGAGGGERSTLSALYLDTEHRHLARAGLTWRLRREGRRWIQTLVMTGSPAHERFEHEVIRPNASWDPGAHARMAAGERLQAVLDKAEAAGAQVGVRYQAELRRMVRRVRTRGAVVEVCFDEGRLIADDSRLQLRELEFALVSGSPTALAALAERWRERFDLAFEPRSTGERGDLLARGLAAPQLRKAERPTYASDASARVAFGAVLDECIDQITRNAIGVCEGDPELVVEHVHQMRVGMRRLRSALRCFEGWVDLPPQGLVEELRELFAQLGRTRDSDVLQSGVAAELARAGAPEIWLPAVSGAVDPVHLVRTGTTQRLWLAWMAWRLALDERPAPLAPASSRTEAATDEASPEVGQAPDMAADAAVGEEHDATPHDLARQASRRLRQWHRRIVADSEGFEALDEDGLHGLRKRIKRQRYAVEFFSTLLTRRSVDRYLKALAAVQDRMGELNDLFVARANYQAIVDRQPAAWFALGWITAKLAELRARSWPALRRLARAQAPRR